MTFLISQIAPLAAVFCACFMFPQVCNMWQGLQEAVVATRAQQDRARLRREEVLLRDL